MITKGYTRGYFLLPRTFGIWWFSRTGDTFLPTFSNEQVRGWKYLTFGPLHYTHYDLQPAHSLFRKPPQFPPPLRCFIAPFHSGSNSNSTITTLPPPSKIQNPKIPSFRGGKPPAVSLAAPNHEIPPIDVDAAASGHGGLHRQPASMMSYYRKEGNVEK